MTSPSPIRTPPEFSTRWKTFFHTVEKRPLLMGILNLTPDSFSDGGLHATPSAALEHALRLEADGADILDLGAESTRPGHTPVDAAEECRRLLPALQAIRAATRLPISVDTRHAETARAAFDLGADVLNDVSGLADSAMLDFARRGNFPVVLMHGMAHALRPDDARPAETVATWFHTRLEELEMARARLWLDPGIGFGTTREQDIALLANIPHLAKLGLPVLIGASRKRVTRFLAPDEDPDATSARLALAAWKFGASILRVHHPGLVRAQLSASMPSAPHPNPRNPRSPQ